MPKTIAISGKGGSGKTTISAMIARLLCGKGSDGVFAVDGDPNCCLGMALGAEATTTISQLREKAAQKKNSSNISSDKVRSFEYDIQQAIVESKGFDLITMGQPEGPGCYCAANNLLRSFLDKLSSAYDFVINDNEAGMEHLSRRTTNKVDLLFIVAEPTAVGIVTVQRIFKLASRLPISIGEIGIIWNKTDTGKDLDGIETFGSIPYDKALFDISMDGKTIFDLDSNSPAFVAVRNILKQKEIL